MNRNLLKFLVGFLLIAVSALADISGNGGPQSNYIEIYNISNGNFDLPAVIFGESQSDITNIQATKDVISSGKTNSPNIRLAVKMPPTPAKLDIVLAMDTSGSMMMNYLKDPKKMDIEWISDAISPILEKYKEARVSIVSWDDENEVGDSASPFYDVATNRADIQTELKKLPSECLETDNTVYSIGIKRAVQVMDQYPPEDPVNTARIIILVTGLSEFRAEPKNGSSDLTLDYQLKNSKRDRNYGKANKSFNGYQIYPVQIGIDERFKWESENLSKIAESTRIRGQPDTSRPYDNINQLDTAISKILDGLKSRPVAHNVEVIDTLYPYLSYLSSDESPYSIVNNSDGSTTLKWYIDAMKGENTWSTTIYTRLKLNLPTDVSMERTKVGYGISNVTPISEVKYTWLTGYNGSIPFPEGRIVFSSGGAN